MKYIELFAGIGGFRNGLEGVCVQDKGQSEGLEAGDKKGQSDEQPDECVQGQFTCVWANEIDKYACQIYRKNFGEEELYEGDIKKVKTSEIPDHDLLVGGFPCQSFSIAGKRGGFNDTRGTLFFEIARVLKDKRPRCVLLENVKGLLSHDSGKTFQTILKVLSDLGYRVEWQVLNSKNFGVPQNRERVFIIGHLRGTGGGKVFPIGGTSGETLRELTEKSMQGDKADVRAVQDMKIAPCLNANDNRKGYTGQARQFFNKIGMIRRLTPTECERLQGFPDGWTEGISDTQRYKCLGNAVTTNVIKAIGERLISNVKQGGSSMSLEQQLERIAKGVEDLVKLVKPAVSAPTATQVKQEAAKTPETKAKPAAKKAKTKKAKPFDYKKRMNEIANKISGFYNDPAKTNEAFAELTKQFKKSYSQYQTVMDVAEKDQKEVLDLVEGFIKKRGIK